MKSTQWQLLSVLLQYPEPELMEERGELSHAAAGRPEIERFLAWLSSAGLDDAQRVYVETFDFDRRAALHLTYHTHGDRRQRGVELVRLKRRFADAGLPLTGSELPDYLPVLLEFAALVPTEGEELLNEVHAPIELVRARLNETQNPYAALLDAVVTSLPKLTKAQVAAARRIAEEGPPTELVGLEPFAVGAAT